MVPSLGGGGGAFIGGGGGAFIGGGGGAFLGGGGGAFLGGGGVCRPRYHPMEARTAFEEIGRRKIVDRPKEKVDL